MVKAMNEMQMSAAAAIAESSNGKVFMAWLAECEAQTLAAVQSSREEMPFDRGASFEIKQILKVMGEARNNLNTRLKDKQ